MKKFTNIVANTIIDDNKTYQDGKKLYDFFEHKADFGIAIIKGDKVLFAKNYKSYNKATEAYETAIAMSEVYGYKPDNELIVCMWNWHAGAYEAYCLFTEEVNNTFNKIHNKFLKFIFEETTEKQRQQIKEIHISKKNYKLLSKRLYGLDFNNYPVIIDNSVTDDFKVIYKEN